MAKQINIKLLAVIIALFALFTLRQSLMTPPKIDDGHAFNTQAAHERLVRILGDEAPHPVDSASNDAVRERLLTEIRGLGFMPIVRDDFHCNEGSRRASCARVQNVMFWVGDAPAADAGADAVMVASHYDSVPTGPGAADDGSGVAASLEIARVLKSRNLPKPVLVMITDGEEIGLVGASSFVKTDPLAKYIGAVVSMEARGVGGPVALIETSTPNSRDIDILKSDIQKPVASSLAADLYAAMPNGTDVTEYLAMDIDAANLALGSGAAFYHTPRDNLAMLDKRSFFHMGATALSSVETYLAADTSKPETQKIYIDIWGLFVISLPQIMALVTLVLGVAVTLSASIKSGKAYRWKSLLFPPAALIAGIGLAIGLTMVINTIRPEAHFAAAHPWALRGMQNIAALLGALIVFRFMARFEAKSALIASGWLWMTVLLAAAFILPGATILFVPALMIASIGLAAQVIGKVRVAMPIVFIAAALFTAIGIQISALGEIMLFAEYAAPFTLFVVLSFALLAPLTLTTSSPKHSVSRPIIVGAALITTAFTIAAALLPAYSADAPRGMSVEHIASSDGTFEYRVRGTDPVPGAMAELADFKAEARRQSAPAPEFSAPLTAAYQIQDGQLTVDITAPTMDTFDIEFTGLPDAPRDISVNAVTLPQSKAARFRCTGRSCRALTFKMPAPTQPATATIYGYQYSLGPESAVLLAARPDWALPQHRGDRRRVSLTVDIAP